jgi:hypothetical protein
VAFDDDARLRAYRLRCQLLSGSPARTPEDVVGRILAVQAQDERGLRLAVRSRSTGLTVADVDAAFDDRRLVVTWLNRGTLHLVRTEDYRWLHSLTAPRVAPRVHHRLRGLGVGAATEERGVAVVVAAVENEGPLSRHQLRERLEAAGVPTAGQVLIHLLASASLQGLVVRGPVVDGHHAYVSVERWLGPPPAGGDRSEYLERLGRRYLAGHAPAGPPDLAAWAGITLGDARTALAPVGGVSDAPHGRRPSLPPPRLLGPFDPLLHGWASRSPFVGDHGSLVTSNGIFRPSCLVDGRLVGTWTAPAAGLVLDLFEAVDDGVRSALEREVRRVERFLDRPARPVTWRGR